LDVERVCVFLEELKPDTIVWCLVSKNDEESLSKIELSGLIENLSPDVRFVYISTTFISDACKNEEYIPVIDENSFGSCHHSNGSNIRLKSGYTLNGITEDFFTVAGASSANNAANSGVITATFPETESEPKIVIDTSGIPKTPEYKAKVKMPDGTELSLLVTVEDVTKTAFIDAGSPDLASGDVEITMPSVQGVNAYALGISVASLSANEKQGTLTFNTDTGSIAIPADMLKGISGSKRTVTIGQGDKNGLPPDVKAAIGSRPLIRLMLSIDGEQIDWNNPDAPVTVSIPYTPTEEELAHPESIVVRYIDGYSPSSMLTRGEFIVMLMRAYGIEPDMNPTDNFSDAGNTYYTGYLAAQKGSRLQKA
jgi:hypothetical protein